MGFGTFAPLINIVKPIFKQSIVKQYLKNCNTFMHRLSYSILNRKCGYMQQELRVNTTESAVSLYCRFSLVFFLKDPVFFQDYFDGTSYRGRES